MILFLRRLFIIFPQSWKALEYNITVEKKSQIFSRDYVIFSKLKRPKKTSWQRKRVASRKRQISTRLFRLIKTNVLFGNVWNLVLLYLFRDQAVFAVHSVTAKQNKPASSKWRSQLFSCFWNHFSLFFCWRKN